MGSTLELRTKLLGVYLAVLYLNHFSRQPLA